MTACTLRVPVALVAAVLVTLSGLAVGEVDKSFTVRTFREAAELGGQAFENSVLVPDGTAYYTDHVAHVIRAVDLTTGEVALVAGTEGTGGFQDGDVSTALLFQPRGACISPCDGHMYFVDGGGALLRQLNFKQGTIATVAGTPGQKGFQDGAGRAARFSFARAPLCLANGTIIVADSSSHPALRTVNLPPGTECGHPTPKPAPSPPPSSSSSTDMLVHKLVLVGACSVLAIIAAYMFVKVHGGAWLRDRIQGMRARYAGPPRSSHPEVEDVTSDEEHATPRGGHYLPPAPLPAAPPTQEPDLIALSPAAPSSPTSSSTPPSLPPVSPHSPSAPHSPSTPQHLQPAGGGGSASSGGGPSPPAAASSASAVPQQDPFAGLF